MGVELVEGSDLVVDDGIVWMRTIAGLQAESTSSTAGSTTPSSTRWSSGRIRMLGVPGMMDVYRAGNITIANAPGTGIADDKAIYSYMPEIVEFYTGARADARAMSRPGAAREPDSLQYVLEHLDELVVKEVARLRRLRHAGRAGRRARRRSRHFAAKLAAQPDDYIAQPTLALSTCRS